MNCKECRVEIEESDDAKPRSHGASAHLESCANCSAFREEHLALRGMIGGLEVITAPADFDFRLRARLATLKSERRGQVSWNRYAPSAWSLAIAAAFVIVIVVGLAVRQARLVPGADNGREGIVKTNPVDVAVPSVSPATPIPTNKLPESTAHTPGNLPNLGVTQARRAANKGINPNPKDLRDEGIISMDLGSTSTANTVLPPGIPDPMTLSPSMVAVLVRASMQPTTIMLKDGGAKPQSISLRPVTFGGQDVFETGSTKKGFVPTVQGIW